MGIGMDTAELAAHCCTVTAGVLAALIDERNEERVRMRLAAMRAHLARRRTDALLDLWDLTEAIAFQLADMQREKERAAGDEPAALEAHLSRCGRRPN
jgi:hypothetical protein